MANWMSLRAYGRHRGDVLAAVQKAIKDGRVSAEAVRRGGTGRLTAIDQERADQEWARNTDPVEALKNGKNPEAVAAASAPASNNPAESSRDRDPAGDEHEAPEARGDLLGSSPAAGAAGEDKSYLAARTREKEFQANKAELDYLERVGELVSAAEVRDEQFEIYRQHRDKLEQIPANVAEKLAAETDPQRVEHLLRTAIRTSLNELSRALAIDAAAEEIAGGASVTA